MPDITLTRSPITHGTRNTERVDGQDPRDQREMKDKKIILVVKRWTDSTKAHGYKRFLMEALS
jgi:hypothetical protein